MTAKTPPITYKGKELQKIAIFGLGNAGKTSLIKMILHEFEAFASLRPTTGVDRKSMPFFGRELSIWDFGGQQIYQDDYLNNPMRYFQGMKYLYYVVDMQDTARLEQSIDYFKKVMTNAIDFNPEIQLFIFLHKVDPKYEGNVNFIETEKKFLGMIDADLKKLKTEPMIYKTSIFNPMSVISAFSQPLLGNLVIYDTLSTVVAQFCEFHDLDVGFLFLQYFEIASYYATGGTFKEINKQIGNYLRKLDVSTEVEPFSVSNTKVHTLKFMVDIDGTLFPFDFAIGIDELNPPKNIKKILAAQKKFTEDLKKVLRNAEYVRRGEMKTEKMLADLIPRSELEDLVEEDILEGIEVEGVEKPDLIKKITKRIKMVEADEKYRQKLEKEEKLKKKKST
jgi:Ras-related GTP-binding protein A/B